MLRNWLLLLFPLLFFSSFSGCSDDPDDEWSENNDPSTGISDDEYTLDGASAFARFEDSQLDVPSNPLEPISVVLYTNLAAPQVEITTDEIEEFVYVYEVTPPDMGNDGRCEVMLNVFQNHLQYNDETGSEEVRSRQATLNIVSGGKNLASLNIVQEAPPFCSLDGNVQSTFSTLSFPFTATESTAEICYYLSETPLSSSEASSILYDRWQHEHEELVLQEGQTEFALDFDGLFVNTTYYLYIRPQDKFGNTLYDDYYKEYTASTAAGQSEQDLVLLVSANPANNFTVYIPLIYLFTAITQQVRWIGETAQWKQWQTDFITFNINTMSPQPLNSKCASAEK